MWSFVFISQETKAAENNNFLKVGVSCWRNEFQIAEPKCARGREFSPWRWMWMWEMKTAWGRVLCDAGAAVSCGQTSQVKPKEDQTFIGSLGRTRATSNTAAVWTAIVNTCLQRGIKGSLGTSLPHYERESACRPLVNPVWLLTSFPLHWTISFELLLQLVVPVRVLLNGPMMQKKPKYFPPKHWNTGWIFQWHGFKNVNDLKNDRDLKELLTSALKRSPHWCQVWHRATI